MIVCCRLFLCLNPMPPGVSGVLLKTMLSCDIFFCCIYLSLCVLAACVLANKGDHLQSFGYFILISTTVYASIINFVC